MQTCIDRRHLTAAALAVVFSCAVPGAYAASVPGERGRVAATRSLAGTPQQEVPPSAPAGSAEEVVRTLYRRVSFDAGKDVDWEQVKALFIPEAVIVLRTSRTAMSVFDRDGFVADFVRFVTDAKLQERAFEETILAMKTEETGEVARATVHYSARIPSEDRPGQQGIDVFLLMKRDGAWRIVSVVNEIVRPGVAVPDELRR